MHMSNEIMLQVKTHYICIISNVPKAAFQLADPISSSPELLRLQSIQWGRGVEAWPIETCGYFSEPVIYKVGLTKLLLDAIT